MRLGYFIYLVINQQLIYDVAARLGGGEAGVAAVLSHPFFAELPAGSLSL